MEIIIIVILILLNGIFSMSEMSLVSSKKYKLESERIKGNANAKTAIELAENPNKFLSTESVCMTDSGMDPSATTLMNTLPLTVAMSMVST